MKTISILWIIIIGIQNLAWGWEKHQTLMPMILHSNSLQPLLGRITSAPCDSDDRREISNLIIQLQLNPSTQLPQTSLAGCGSGTQIFFVNLFEGTSVDDPDQGMDQNLPTSSDNSFDPNGDRKWMGGTEGATSQGFRHMYFGGWRITSPLTTFQVPLYAIGQAPNRVDIISQKAKDLIKEGNVAWGIRVLNWALHYLQDLAQPFHSVQIVNLKMVPWEVLLHWPLNEAFSNLVSETTRVVANFHFAYEGYVLNRLKLNELSPFYICLTSPEAYTKLRLDPKTQTPHEFVERVIDESISIAPQIGSAEYAFFGGSLIQKGVDLVSHPQLLDYSDYSSRPDLRSAREDLHFATCRALANTSIATRALIEWALKP